MTLKNAQKMKDLTAEAQHARRRIETNSRIIGDFYRENRILEARLQQIRRELGRLLWDGGVCPIPEPEPECDCEGKGRK